jgi:hypothetical protein
VTEERHHRVLVLGLEEAAEVRAARQHVDVVDADSVISGPGEEAKYGGTRCDRQAADFLPEV